MLELRGNDLLIWLAALIDGEGSIMLTKRVRSNKAKVQRKDHFRTSVVICGTDIRLLETLVVNTGILRIYSHRVNGAANTPRKRQMWTWRLASEDIRLWLPAIRPYLVIKGEQADLLLEALDIKHQITPGNAGFMPTVRPALIERLGSIYGIIRSLNTRGRILEGICL